MKKLSSQSSDHSKPLISQIEALKRTNKVLIFKVLPRRIKENIKKNKENVENFANGISMNGYINCNDEKRPDRLINAQYLLKAVADDFKCTVCYGMLQDPVILPECNHIFCRVCIKKCWENRPFCPLCLKPISHPRSFIAPHVMPNIIQLARKIGHSWGIDDITDYSQHDEKEVINSTKGIVKKGNNILSNANFLNDDSPSSILENALTQKIKFVAINEIERPENNILNLQFSSNSITKKKCIEPNSQSNVDVRYVSRMLSDENYETYNNFFSETPVMKTVELRLPPNLANNRYEGYKFYSPTFTHVCNLCRLNTSNRPLMKKYFNTILSLDFGNVPFNSYNKHELDENNAVRKGDSHRLLINQRRLEIMNINEERANLFWGKLIGPFLDNVYIHELCLVCSPQIKTFLNEDKTPNICGIEEAINIGGRQKCYVCGTSGATLSSNDNSSLHIHIPCALITNSSVCSIDIGSERLIVHCNQIS